MYTSFMYIYANALLAGSGWHGAAACCCCGCLFFVFVVVAAAPVVVVVVVVVWWLLLLLLLLLWLLVFFFFCFHCLLRGAKVMKTLFFPFKHVQSFPAFCFVSPPGNQKQGASRVLEKKDVVIKKLLGIGSKHRVSGLAEEMPRSINIFLWAEIYMQIASILRLFEIMSVCVCVLLVLLVGFVRAA